MVKSTKDSFATANIMVKENLHGLMARNMLGLSDKACEKVWESIDRVRKASIRVCMRTTWLRDMVLASILTGASMSGNGRRTRKRDLESIT